MIPYYPYKSDKPEKKYYIITATNRKVYFGAAGMSDYTHHKDDERKLRYIKRHSSNENCSKTGIDTAGWWSYRYLWSYPTKEEAYYHIKKDLKRWGYI